MLDLGSAWSTEKPVGSRDRFLRGLDSWLGWLHCFCILSVQVKKGERVFLMTQGHPAGQLPASAVSFQLSVSLEQERENDRTSHLPKACVESCVETGACVSCASEAAGLDCAWNSVKGRQMVLEQGRDGYLQEQPRS